MLYRTLCVIRRRDGAHARGADAARDKHETLDHERHAGADGSLGRRGAGRYPDRPCGWWCRSARGITDIVARQVGKGLGDALGQPVVVENRPGAGGVIAAQLAASAPADGYTIFMGTVGTQVVNPLIYRKLAYDADSYVPLGLVSGSPYLLAVRASLPTQDFAQFAAYAKANPAKLNFGSAGQASSPHLGLELLKMTAGLDIVHVPFKSGSEAVNAAIGGQVDVVMDASPVIMPHVAAGKLRALAVASDRPLPSAPGVPSSAQAGDAGLQISSWNAFFAPAGAAGGGAEAERRAAPDAGLARAAAEAGGAGHAAIAARPRNTSVSSRPRRQSGPRSSSAPTSR